jgi:hypothetical protein
MVPSGVIRPIWSTACSVNQTAPSGPAVIPSGSLPGVGMPYSWTAPSMVMRPMWLLPGSVNQRAPSGPVVIRSG